VNVTDRIAYARRFGTEGVELDGLSAGERGLLKTELNRVDASWKGKSRRRRPRRRTRTEMRAAVAILRAEGLVLGAIADRLGVSDAYVARLLSESAYHPDFVPRKARGQAAKSARNARGKGSGHPAPKERASAPAGLS